jgi:4-hydroxy-tetrahydrodipicolinate reductase
VRLDLVVIGAGRMGRAVLVAASRDPGIAVHAVVRRRPEAERLPDGIPCLGDVDAALARAAAGVVVDVAPGTGASDRIARVARAGWALVEGATGLDSGAEAALTEASRRVAVVVAPNLSPGAALQRRLLRVLAEAREPGWEAGILDRHHAGKRDAPSGTARLLAEILAPWGEVPVVSLRQGGVVGEHTVHAAGTEEEIVLTHRVFSRSVFAAGALRAARFAAAAAPGRYVMEDVLRSEGGGAPAPA